MADERAWIKPWVSYSMALISIVIVVIAWWFCWFNTVTTVLVVRHAEKADAPPPPPPPNPPLTMAGQARAQALVNVAGDAGVAAIYATEWCRTAQTAHPLAEHLGLSINVQQNMILDDALAECDPPINVLVNGLAAEIDTAAELVDLVLTQHRGGVVFIVGHSNTVPQIVEELGATPIAPIDEDEYDNLFIVTKPRFFGTTKIVKAKYGVL